MQHQQRTYFSVFFGLFFSCQALTYFAWLCNETLITVIIIIIIIHFLLQQMSKRIRRYI